MALNYHLKEEKAMCISDKTGSSTPRSIEFCWLIDLLVKDIQHLESETVKTRYELSKHLIHPYDVYLRSDILSDLSVRYTDNPTYQFYIQLFYDGQDPMETDEFNNHIYRLSHGLK